MFVYKKNNSWDAFRNEGICNTYVTKWNKIRFTLKTVSPSGPWSPFTFLYAASILLQWATDTDQGLCKLWWSLTNSGNSLHFKVGPRDSTHLLKKSGYHVMPRCETDLAHLVHIVYILLKLWKADLFEKQRNF